MAICRSISLSFWTDSKVDDDFTPEDKYFYLYLLTNPHTNICGCYELGEKQCSRETGYNQETVSRLLKRFEEVHDVIRYNPKAKEVLILNWYKYNWTTSEKLEKCVRDTSQTIKTDSYRQYILDLLERPDDTVSIPYPQGIDTSTITNTITKAIANTNTKANTEEDSKDEIEELFGYNQYLLEAVRDWFEYKKQRKEKYQPVGMKSLLTMIQNNVSKYGEDSVVEVIRESMGSGYKGILWDKLKNQRQQGGKKKVSFADFL